MGPSEMPQERKQNAKPKVSTIVHRGYTGPGDVTEDTNSYNEKHVHRQERKRTPMTRSQIKALFFILYRRTLGCCLNFSVSSAFNVRSSFRVCVGGDQSMGPSRIVPASREEKSNAPFVSPEKKGELGRAEKKEFGGKKKANAYYAWNPTRDSLARLLASQPSR